MKNIIAAGIGIGVGLVGGYLIGSRSLRKANKELLHAMEDLELFYDEQMTALEEQVKEIKANMAQKTYKIDDEEVEVLNEDEWEEVEDDNDIKTMVEKVTGNKINVTKERIRPVDDDEAISLVANDGAQMKTVYLFSCGTLTDETKEPDRVIMDTNKLIGYEILNRLSEYSEDETIDDRDVFPYYIYNEDKGIVYEVLKDDRTYREYLVAIGEA